MKVFVLRVTGCTPGRCSSGRPCRRPSKAGASTRPAVRPILPATRATTSTGRQAPARCSVDEAQRRRRRFRLHRLARHRHQPLMTRTACHPTTPAADSSHVVAGPPPERRLPDAKRPRCRVPVSLAVARFGFRLNEQKRGGLARIPRRRRVLRPCCSLRRLLLFLYLFKDAMWRASKARQNIPLVLADLAGTACITSQCSTIRPSSTRKMSTTACPRSSGNILRW